MQVYKLDDLQMTEQPWIIHQARWVVPMDGPVLADGAVAVAGDHITAVGPAAELLATRQPGTTRHYDHGEGAIIPALVNAHVHLEFTALRHTIAPQKNLPAWLQTAIDGFSTLEPVEIDQGIQEGIAEMRRFGTILAAEVRYLPGGVCPFWQPVIWLSTIFTNAWGLTGWPKPRWQRTSPFWPSPAWRRCR